MAREINLVPEIKNEMIKALKLRNLIFFICIVAVISSIAVVVILSTVVGGQQLALNGKDVTLGLASDKINGYDEIGDFLTIRDQVEKLNEISDDKNVFSRTFGIMAAFLPTGQDRITISKLNVNLSGDKPKLYIEAQANAEKAPYIDYNVLDAFKKSMPYMRYDYGNYVDANDNLIPAYCIIETDYDGSQFYENGRGNYAYWTAEEDGCRVRNEEQRAVDYDYEYYDNKTVVRIWRTPQFETWFDNGQMSADGIISGVQHFESKCIKYNRVSANKWIDTNDECLLVPDGVDGIVVNESSNGRESNGELVLRFSATITVDPEAYKFANKHMLAIAPSGRHNVTDSYIQIREMFSERAEDCSDNDDSCKKIDKGEAE